MGRTAGGGRQTKRGVKGGGKRKSEGGGEDRRKIVGPRVGTERLTIRTHIIRFSGGTYPRLKNQGRTKGDKRYGKTIYFGNHRDRTGGEEKIPGRWVVDFLRQGGYGQVGMKDNCISST